MLNHEFMPLMLEVANLMKSLFVQCVLLLR